MRVSICLLSAMLAVAPALGLGAAEREVIAPPGADIGLPFSPAIASGDLIYVSGAIPNRPGTLDCPGDIGEQMHRLMGNLSTVLEAAGADLSHVVSVNVFLSDTRHYQAMNEVYRTYFEDAPPTRATVQADIAIPGALAEVSMVAVRPGVERKVVMPKGLKAPELPYSWGILAGDTLFIAGATSRAPETYQPVAGDITVQTRQVLTNIGAVLEAAEMGYGDVVSCRVFLDDARDFQAMNEVYRSFFPKAPPTRATVRARLMNPLFKSEIQCLAVKDPSRKAVASEVARPGAPFSPAIQVGDRLYLSGMIGRGPDGLVPDIKAQTRQTLENLRATLKAAGMDFGNVVDTWVILSDVRHYAAMNEVYRETLPSPPPARATVGAQLMSPDALVEIMMVATR